MAPSGCTGCSKGAHSRRHSATCNSCNTKAGTSEPAIDLTVEGDSPPPSSPDWTPPRRPSKKQKQRAEEIIIMDFDTDSDDDVTLLTAGMRGKTWTCDVCGLINDGAAIICDVCENEARDATTAAPASASSSGNSGKKKWTCPMCTLNNPEDDAECTVCGALKPTASSPQPAAPTLQSPCPTCSAPNALSRAGVCQACGFVVPPPAPPPLKLPLPGRRRRGQASSTPMPPQGGLAPLPPNLPQPPTNPTTAAAGPCRSCAYYAARKQACQMCGNPNLPWTCTVCGYAKNSATGLRCGTCFNSNFDAGYICPQCFVQNPTRGAQCPSCAYALGSGVHKRKAPRRPSRGARHYVPPPPANPIPPGGSLTSRLSGIMNRVSGMFGPPLSTNPPPNPLTCLNEVIQRGASEQHFTLQAVQAGSGEYNTVSGHMGAYAGSVCGVTKVVRCFQTPRVAGVRADYESRGIVVQPRPVWHGTDIAAIENILTKGFAVIPNPRNGRAWGHGIYLSPISNTVQSIGYSHQDTAGTRHMLLCHLFARKTEAFQSREQWQAHDAHAEAAETPSMLVVFQAHCNTALLPMYIVSFK